MGNRRDFLIKTIVELCQKLDIKGWVANHDGNITARYEETLLATPTAVAKADIVPEMILVLDMQGKKLQGIGNPFSEVKLHIAAYNARPEIQAVVHAHPPFAMARGLTGGDFEINVPEAIVSIGDIVPVTPYAFPGAPENDRIVEDALNTSDLFIMPGNGVLSVGRDLKEAYLRMELLEHLLRIDHIARVNGPTMTIPYEDKQKLLEKRASLGLGPKKSALTSHSTDKQEKHEMGDLIKDIIAQEIKKIFQNSK